MRTRGVWPWMVAATILVMVLPAAVVWALSALGVITTLWAGVALSALLALAASSAGSAFWRRRTTGDVLFSDLLLWGWLRRRRMEGRLGRADELLEQAGGAETEHKAALLHELGAALDAQDPYLDGHSRRVTRYVTMIARRMDLPDEDVERVRAAAAVHDVGKLHMPREVVYKPGPLTDQEFELLKQHAGEGGEMVECVGDPALAAAIRSHHERWDGSGYPDGLAGEQIPIEARIISVADTFDAITCARSYRPATPHARALEVIAAEAGEQLDPTAARAFISCYSDRRGAALWASLLSLPRQLASRLSMTPAELTGAATAALTAPMIVVAGAAASAALPAPATDTPAATPQPVALSQPASTPGASPTPTRSPTAAVVPPTPTSAGAAPPAAATPSPPSSPTPAVTVTPTPVPTLMPLPLPAFATPTPTPAAVPPAPSPSPTPTPTPTPTSAPTPTATPTPPPPHSVDDCRNGGWIDLGYANQGECIAGADKP